MIYYKGFIAGRYRCDLLVEERVVVEAKSSAILPPTSQRQLLNCLRCGSIDVGLVLHYGPDPKFYRLVSPRVLDDH